MKLFLVFFLSLIFFSCTPTESGIGTLNTESPEPSPEDLNQFKESMIPRALSSAILVFPENTNSDSDVVEISVQETIPGATLRIFSDNICSVELASLKAIGDETIINIQLNNPGVYHFFATQEISSELKSSCSEKLLTYIYEVPNVPDYDIQKNAGLPASGTMNSFDLILNGFIQGHDVSLFVDSLCHLPISTQNVLEDSVTFPIVLTEEGDYVFYVTITNMYGTSSCKEVHRYSYGQPPSVPQNISLVFPASSPGLTKTPTLKVTGVNSGDEVKIFSDSSCQNEVGSSVAENNNSVLVTLNELSLYTSYEFYTSATNFFGESPCSENFLAYELKESPITTNKLLAYFDVSNSRSYPASGNIWYDLTGNNNHITLVGPTFSTASGGLFSFDGVNDYATSTTLGNAISQQIDSDFTHEVWVMFRRNADVYEWMTNLSTRNTYNNLFRFFRWRSGLGGVLGFNSIISDIRYDSNDSLSSSQSVGKILRYSFVFKKENGLYDMHLYRNGILISTTKTNFTTYNLSSLQMYFEIGRDAYFGQFSAINIYDLSWYTRALTSEEILNNFNQTKTRFGY